MATSAQLLKSLATSPRRVTVILHALIVTAILLAVTVLFQIAGAAYSSDLSGFPDEPAHFVTGLMIRDYIAAGAPGPPVAYAENYYLHYPKVAFGMWGPLLHITEAVWMLIFPPSRTAALVLMALITAATASLLYHVLRSRFGFVASGLAALIFIANPIVQRYTGLVMADGLVALMDFAAALAFGTFLQTGNWKSSLQFGVFTCLSILAKGNGVALLLLPALAILFSRQIGMLKRRSMWIGPVIIACIAGPWQYYSAAMLSGILERQAPFAFTSFYFLNIALVPGLVLFPFAVAGFWDKIIRPWKDNLVDGQWASAAALIFSVVLFHCLIPATAPEHRYLIAIVPPMLMFTMAGAGWLAHRLKFGPMVLTRTPAIAAVLTALFFATAFYIPHKVFYGYDEVAAFLQRPEYRNAIIMASSEGAGEGLLVSEIVLREPRPSHIVLRAGKMLGQGNWDNRRYELAYSTPEKVLEYLQSIPVDIVVLDNDKGFPAPHHALLRQTIAAYPQEWTRLGTWPQSRPGAAVIEVYRLRTTNTKPRERIRINMPYTLGRPIEGHGDSSQSGNTEPPEKRP